MCLICVDIQRDAMKANEVSRALGEMSIPEEHQEELVENILAKGAEFFKDVFGLYPPETK